MMQYHDPSSIKRQNFVSATLCNVIMARKRTYEDVERIDDVDGPISSTRMHGAIISLSPVKKGRKSIFFDGMLADNTSKIRLVGFDAQQQRKLNDYHQKNFQFN